MIHLITLFLILVAFVAVTASVGRDHGCAADDFACPANGEGVADGSVA